MSESDKTEPKLFFERHEDDEIIDEIHITTVPRFKTSGLSGDEWRVSYQVEIKRKGQVLKTVSRGRLSYAVQYLGADIGKLEGGTAGTPEYDWDHDKTLCFQPGCSEPAISTYAKVKDWCPRCGRSHEISEELLGKRARRFCRRHLRRGDCGTDSIDDVPGKVQEVIDHARNDRSVTEEA